MTLVTIFGNKSLVEHFNGVNDIFVICNKLVHSLQEPQLKLFKCGGKLNWKYEYLDNCADYSFLGGIDANHI